MHRVVEIAWLPRSSRQWATFTEARRAAGDLWSVMVKLHARIRRLRWSWPSRSRWEAWARGRFLGLSAQSAQQVVAEFCDAVSSASAARKAQRADGTEVAAAYPSRLMRYRAVTYTNQSAVLRGGFLRLSHGKVGRPLRIRLPAGLVLPGRLMEVSLGFGIVRLVCKVDDTLAPTPSGVTIGVDLGVNTLLAATDGETAVLVSGREMKAIQQYRNKQMASLKSRLSKTKKGSRFHKRLQRRKHKHLDRCARKQRDLAHKATRVVADAFPGAHVVVGKPFNRAADKMAPRQAQQVSQAVNAKLIAQLDYKMAGAEQRDEAWSSQTCPVCGCRQKCRRVYRCGACGFVAPRDVVGSTNIRSIGLFGEMRLHQPVATVVRYVRPLRKYPATPQGVTGSSGGTPASRSAVMS